MFKYLRLTKGLLGANTYICYNDATLECAIIDAGNKTEDVLNLVCENKLKVRYIILTHAHYDHIFYVEQYKMYYPDAPVVLHEDDSSFMGNPRLNASIYFGPEKRFPECDMTVKDSDRLPLGEGELIFYSTPGHTTGSVCIQADNLLFTGDTLFYGGFGRTDLGAGSWNQLSSSIDFLYKMDPDLIVLPGHGTKSTIGYERENNPFI